MNAASSLLGVLRVSVKNADSLIHIFVAIAAINEPEMNRIVLHYCLLIFLRCRSELGSTFTFKGVRDGKPVQTSKQAIHILHTGSVRTLLRMLALSNKNSLIGLVYLEQVHAFFVRAFNT